MLIKIVRLPKGEAPEEVRKAWVGCKLPITDFAEFHLAEEVLSRKPRLKKGFFVHALSALAILKEKSQAAAEWFERNMELTSSNYFCFNEKECEIISYEII